MDALETAVTTFAFSSVWFLFYASERGEQAEPVVVVDKYQNKQ